MFTRKQCLAAAATMLVTLITACSSTAPAVSSSAADSAALTAQSAVQPSDSTAVDRTSVRLAGLKGPTAMGLVQLMRRADNGSALHNYAIDIFGSPDEIAPALLSGNLDAALLPCNLASVLYNKSGGEIQVAAISNLGVLSVLSTDNTIKSLSDLKGKTLYATGKGTTPEYVLEYLLKQNGMTPNKDITVQYFSEATEVLSALQNNSAGAAAMLPQPYATTALMQNEALHTVLDLNEEWKSTASDSALVTGVLAVRRDFAQKHPTLMQEFLSEYSDSIAWVNDTPQEAAALIEQYGIVPKADVAQQALPLCNLHFAQGAEMKQLIEGYLQVLYEANPASVGGALPNEDFYYGA